MSIRKHVKVIISIFFSIALFFYGLYIFNQAPLDLNGPIYNGPDGLAFFQEELVPYDLRSDVQDEYLLNIKTNLMQKEIFLPAQTLCVMVEKYIEGMKCRFQDPGTHDGELELISEAILLDQVAQTGRYGLSPKNQKQIVSPLYSLAFQCVVRKSSGIRSISELKGKRVAIGSHLSEERLLTQQILKTHQLDIDDYEPVYLNLEEATKAMELDLVDCIATHAPLPSQSISRMAANFDIALLPLDNNELIDDINRQLPGYELITIPSQAYKGIDRYILTAATKVILASERETKMFITYELTKALYDHLAEFKSIFPIDQEIKSNQINDSYLISFHQGAAKYYWERDLIWN